jgi:CDP-4-dehydro-6-deoxyglucose reductase
VQVRLRSTDRVFTVAPGESVLAAALAAGIRLPFSCTGGRCGSCRAHLHSGQISYPRFPERTPPGLSAAESEAGDVLLCQAIALTDLELDTPEVRSRAASEIRQFPCRIEFVAESATGERVLHLRLPRVEAFDLRVGQFVALLLSEGRRQPAVIAGAPIGGEPLEVRIDPTPGAVTTSTSGEMRLRALLRVEGPYESSTEAAQGCVADTLNDT